MLTKLDDTLFHQAPTTFDHAVTSDHRFFDRYWIQALEPDGPTAVMVGMGVYKNTNVLDGFCLIARGDRQYNTRFSRALRPNVDEQRVGPLAVEPIEPLRVLHLLLEPGPERPIGCDLTWTGTFDPVEEQPMWRRLDGRVQTQGVRFYQLGRVDGWIEVEGERVEVANWYGTRDHSWGVRPGTGGYEPMTGMPRQVAPEFVRSWLSFSIRELAGVVDVTNAARYHRATGDFVRPNGSTKPALKVVEAEIDISFLPGGTPAETPTVAFDGAELRIVTDDGQSWDVRCEVRSPPWVLRGAGYDMGYRDGRGLGPHRGEYLEEGEILDIADRHAVFELPARTPYEALHREHSLHVTVNGVPGRGHLMVWADPTDDVEAHLYDLDQEWPT